MRRPSLRAAEGTSLPMRPKHHVRSLIFGLCCLFGALSAHGQYVAGDYGSWASGNWNTAATWRIYDGTSWGTSPAAVAAPGANNRVFIRTGTTVTAVFGTTYYCTDLIVETGGKLFNNNTGATNLSYITILGSVLTCDGQIGNGATLDGISFNLDGLNVSISGTGIFDAARFRKFHTAHPLTLAPLTTTNLTIAMNVNLRFSGGSNTMIYNNASSASNFHVTIGAGATVALIGAAGAGNIAMDGVVGSDGAPCGGSYTINGILLIPGTLYISTNNVNPLQEVRFTINNGGYVRTMQMSSAASGTAWHRLFINAGGTLEITGSPISWSSFNTVNNQFSLNAGSRVIYSGTGAQNVANIGGGYGHLRIIGGGTKTLMGLTTVKGNVEIMNTTGTPELDVSASNFQLSVQGNWMNYAQAGFNERTGIVQFNSTAALQSITTTGGEQFYTLRFAKNVLFPTVTMNSNVTVTNALEFNGSGVTQACVLDLNGHELGLLNGLATAITTNTAFGTAKHIRSELTSNLSRVRWDIGTTTGAHLVPFGMATDYVPFTFNLVSGDAGSMTAATYGTPATNLPWPVAPTAVTNLASVIGLTPDNRDATVDRFWQVDVTGTPIAHLTFGYAASELPIAPWNDPLSLRAQRWDSAAQTWNDQLESGGSAAYYAIANNVSAFGPFTLSPLGSPLPIELLAFNARLVGAEVWLDWATASEVDNDHFTVLRSADGIWFEEVADVAAVGHSFTITNYSALDRQPFTGLSYYRLRQTDTDGRSTESDMVPVMNEMTGSTIVLYPNPVVDQLQVMGLATPAAELRILDATGRLVLQVRKPGDLDRATVPMAGLPAGSYTLIVLGDAAARSVRFIRQ
jgi:hypothetical protein